MYEVSYNNKSLLKTYFLNLTHTSKTVQTETIFTDHTNTYLWAHFNLTVEAVCVRYKETKTIDQAHHITPKLSQPFLWVSHGRMTLFFVWHGPFGTWDVQWRRFVFPDDEALNHSATAKTLIKCSRQTWKKHKYEKILEKR